MAAKLTVPVFVAQQYRADEVMGAIARVQLGRMDGILADLRRVRDAIAPTVADGRAVRLAPSNDPAGDCGVMAAFQFDDEARARRFTAAPDVGGFVLIDHGKHVFNQWEPLRAKRFAHHPAMNPFAFPQNRDLRAAYGDEVCPRTLAILRRTVFVPMDPDWDDAQVQTRIRVLRAAAGC